MFQVNDYVVYGSSGVCKVLEIGTPEIHGIDKSKLYYKLQPMYSKGSIIYTPLDNEKQLIRRIITKEEAIALINSIPNIDMIEVPNEKYREAAYKEYMRRNNCGDLIKLIKTLYIKNQERLSEGRKIASSDLKYLHDAEECLYGELSIPLNIPREKMEEFISARVKTLELI